MSLNRSRSQLRVFQPQFSEEARQGLVCPRWIPQRRQSWSPRQNRRLQPEQIGLRNRADLGQQQGFLLKMIL